MFFNSFLQSPDEAAGSDVTASAPVNSSSTTAVPTTNDLFDGFADKIGLGNKEHDENAFGQDEYNNNEPSDSETIEEYEQNLEPEKQAETEDDNLPLYVFKEKLGDREIELNIENKEQLDHYLKRAAIAPEIFKENKQLRTEVATYKERAADADEFDRMVAEEPVEILNAIIEDMNEEKLAEWVKDLSQNLQQSAEQKEYFRKLRQAEYVLRQQERQQQQQQQFEQKRLQAIEQENIKQVQNWRQNEFQKWSSKLPAETHAILSDMIDDQLAYASRLANEGHDVDLITLTNRLARYANTIAGSQKSINKKVGQATQAARQQATNKLQASTNRMNAGRNQNGAGSSAYKNTDDMWADLIRKVGSGEVRVKG
jgi:hypothetical protein